MPNLGILALASPVTSSNLHLLSFAHFLSLHSRTKGLVSAIESGKSLLILHSPVNAIESGKGHSSFTEANALEQFTHSLTD